MTQFLYLPIPSYETSIKMDIAIYDASIALKGHAIFV